MKPASHSQVVWFPAATACAGHVAQVAWPVWAVKEVGEAHSWQLKAPRTGATLPSAHAVQLRAVLPPSAIKRPNAHKMQLTCPTTSWRRPGAQLAHAKSVVSDEV